MRASHTYSSDKMIGGCDIKLFLCRGELGEQLRSPKTRLCRTRRSPWGKSVGDGTQRKAGFRGGGLAFLAVSRLAVAGGMSGEEF